MHFLLTQTFGWPHSLSVKHSIQSKSDLQIKIVLEIRVDSYLKFTHYKTKMMDCIQNSPGRVVPQIKRLFSLQSASCHVASTLLSIWTHLPLFYCHNIHQALFVPIVKYVFLSQGCISCGILVSGIRARGVSSEHMENMEMFSCSPT